MGSMSMGTLESTARLAAAAARAAVEERVDLRRAGTRRQAGSAHGIILPRTM
jgi:hypothetical protein